MRDVGDGAFLRRRVFTRDDFCRVVKLPAGFFPLFSSNTIVAAGTHGRKCLMPGREGEGVAD